MFSALKHARRQAVRCCEAAGTLPADSSLLHPASNKRGVALDAREGARGFGLETRNTPEQPEWSLEFNDPYNSQ